jgi:cryptochrome
MEGNPQCRQIPWQWNEEMISAWSESRTGYPFIDAIMTQLRCEGWIHHLARHAVACFLTRGDLFQHWEAVSVFNIFLLVN